MSSSSRTDAKLATESDARQLGKRRLAAFRAMVHEKHLFMPTAAEGGPQYEIDREILQRWVDKQPDEEARCAAAAIARCLRYVSFSQWYAALKTALTAFLRTLPPGHEYVLYVPKFADGGRGKCKSNWWATQHALRLLDGRPPADVCTQGNIYSVMTRLGSPHTVRHILVVDDAIYSGMQARGVLGSMVSGDLLSPWSERPADYLGKIFPNWWREHGARASGFPVSNSRRDAGGPARAYFVKHASTEEIVRLGDEPVHVHLAVGLCTSEATAKVLDDLPWEYRIKGVVFHLHAGSHLATLSEQLGGDARATDAVRRVGVYEWGTLPLVYLQFKVPDTHSTYERFFKNRPDYQVPVKGCASAGHTETCPPTFYHRMPGCRGDDGSWAPPSPTEADL